MKPLKILNTLGPQLYHARLHLPLYVPIKNNDHPWGKPRPGTGLWTSTFDPEKKTSGWLEWCLGDGGIAFYNRYRWGYVYEVAQHLKILEIDSQSDLEAILDVYGSTWTYPDGHVYYDGEKRFMNFEKIRRAGFHAIHLTDAGQWDTRLPMTGSDLYGWDCESTIWLQLHRNTLKFAQKVRLNQVKGYRWTRKDWREHHQSTRLTMNAFMEDSRKYTEIL